MFLKKLKPSDDEQKYSLVRKEIPIRFPHCPNIFGTRHYECDDSDGVCSKEDVDGFISNAMDESSYNKPSCW